MNATIQYYTTPLRIGHSSSWKEKSLNSPLLGNFYAWGKHERVLEKQSNNQYHFLSTTRQDATTFENFALCGKIIAIGAAVILPETILAKAILTTAIAGIPLLTQIALRYSITINVERLNVQNTIEATDDEGPEGLLHNLEALIEETPPQERNAILRIVYAVATLVRQRLRQLYSEEPAESA
jgi:hypothetical protein